MFRSLAIFLGLVAILGCGIGVAAWPSAQTPQRVAFNAQQLKAAFTRIRAGITPASQLGKLGFDTARATKLTYLGVMEQFMPKDSVAFDGLDPAVQACFTARDHCTAYIFPVSGRDDARVTLLIAGGRVAYKRAAGLELVAAK